MSQAAGVARFVAWLRAPAGNVIVLADGSGRGRRPRAVKRWSRLRLATGCTVTTIGSGALALTRFSRFLATCHPEVNQPAAITRPVLEDYLSWLLAHG